MYTVLVLVICNCFLLQTPLVVVKFPNYVCVFHNPKLQWKLLINAPCILLIINSISPKECNELTPVLLYWILCSGYFQNLKKTIPPLWLMLLLYVVVAVVKYHDWHEVVTRIVCCLFDRCYEVDVIFMTKIVYYLSLCLYFTNGCL